MSLLTVSVRAKRFTRNGTGKGRDGRDDGDDGDDGDEDAGLELLCFFPLPDLSTNLVELDTPTLHP